MRFILRRDVERSHGISQHEQNERRESGTSRIEISPLSVFTSARDFDLMRTLVVNPSLEPVTPGNLSAT
jgi:hypothetical protein